MKRSLVLSWLAISFWPLAAHAVYTSDYDKFYDRAQSICSRTLHPLGIDDCDMEMSRCMSMLFHCARDTATCIDKIHGTRVVSCNFPPFSHDSYNGVCDDSDVLRDVSWNRSCENLPGDKFATPGCNNAVVELSEDCDDGGYKPDKCPDTCQSLYIGVGGNGGVGRSVTDFGPIVGFVPSGTGGNGGTGSDPGMLSEDPPPGAGGDGSLPAPAPAPAPAVAPSNPSDSAAAAPLAANNGSGTSPEIASNSGSSPASSANGDATSAGGCTLIDSQTESFSVVGLMILLLPLFKKLPLRHGRRIT